MADDNNIKNYSASDIEKYHKGQLSSKEMHDLEKAALDDPFLADALEGYAFSGINVNADIAELKKRLADKAGQTKVVSIGSGRTASFSWLRAAVIIVLIAGAGLLAYQFLIKTNNTQENSIVQTPASKNSAPNPGETGNTNTQPANNDTQLKRNGTERLADKNENERKQQQDVAGNRVFNDKELQDSSLEVTATSPSIAATTAPKASAEKDLYKKSDAPEKLKANDTIRMTDDVVAKNKNMEPLAKKPELNRVTNSPGGVVAKQNNATNQGVIDGYANSKAADMNLYRNINIFRGKVTDLNNNALPFANITNTRDNVGTYSDAQGNFTLVSTDSVLNVQVRSLGFQNKNYSLQNALADNKVILQEDRNLPTDTIDKVKRNISRRRNNTMTLEEPEPEDGWDSYGSYVVNNLNVPETFEMRKFSETADNTVEVSFDVNKNGEPVNIRVEKSLCDKCDKEAVRLIREGPKWKRKAKKSKRAIVTVPFIKQD